MRAVEQQSKKLDLLEGRASPPQLAPTLLQAPEQAALPEMPAAGADTPGPARTEPGAPRPRPVARPKAKPTPPEQAQPLQPPIDIRPLPAARAAPHRPERKGRLRRRRRNRKPRRHRGRARCQKYCSAINCRFERRCVARSDSPFRVRSRLLIAVVIEHEQANGRRKIAVPALTVDCSDQIGHGRITTPAISLSAFQNASSRLTLVLCPAMTMDFLTTADFIACPPSRSGGRRDRGCSWRCGRLILRCALLRPCNCRFGGLPFSRLALGSLALSAKVDDFAHSCTPRASTG